METQTGKATPFSYFFLPYTLAHSLSISASPKAHNSTTLALATHLAITLARTSFAIFPAY